MDSFSYNSKFELCKMKVGLSISAKLAFQPVLFLGWKISNIKAVLYVL